MGVLDIRHQKLNFCAYMQFMMYVLLSGLGMHMAGLHTIKFILVMIIYIKGVT